MLLKRIGLLSCRIVLTSLLACATTLSGAVNLPPVVTNFDGNAVSFTQSGPNVLLDAGEDATVTDSDSADFNGGSVTVSIRTNRVDAEDVLFVRNQGSGPGQVGVSGFEVTFGGVLIGTWIGGAGGSNLVVSFNAASTAAAAQALVRALAYNNVNPTNPSAAVRAVATTIDDGDGGSTEALTTVAVVDVNDAPIVTKLIPDVSATYGAPFSFTFDADLFVDPDGDPLTYGAEEVPAGVTLDGPTRTFSGTMKDGGLWRVTLWAMDNRVPPLSVTNTFLIRIAAVPLLVKADDQTRPYGSNNPPLTITYTGFVNDNTAADLIIPPLITTVASNTSLPGTYPITVSGGSDGRYVFSYSNGTMTVTKATVLAVAESKSRAVDEPNPPLTIRYVGLVGQDTEAVLDVRPTISTTATTNDPPGSYPITLSGGSDDNYNIVLVNGTLVIREPGVPRANGTFQGLFYEPSQARNISSGCLTLTTRDGKAFSAVLKIEGRRFPFSGAFNSAGLATNGVLRSGNFPLLVELQLGVGERLDRIGGRVTDFVWSSPLEADPVVTSLATNEAGHYGVVLVGAARAEGPGPYGHSFGTMDVSKRGNVKLALQLCDRLNVSGATEMVTSGRVPCYLPTPGGQGAVIGWLTFSNQPTTDAMGSLGWVRSADPTRVMPSGFEATRTMYATRYTPPGRGERIIDLPEGTLRFEGGALATLVQITNAALTTEHVFRRDGVKLPVQVRPKSGLFLGYIGNLPTPVAKFRGMFLQKTNIGVGFFEGVYSGLESGRVEFVPTP